MKKKILTAGLILSLTTSTLMGCNKPQTLEGTISNITRANGHNQITLTNDADELIVITDTMGYMPSPQVGTKVRVTVSGYMNIKEFEYINFTAGGKADENTEQ